MVIRHPSRPLVFPFTDKSPNQKTCNGLLGSCAALQPLHLPDFVIQIITVSNGDHFSQ